ncbi:MAG: pyruvate kinase [Gammaproteobacteria bacterium]|nr:pyruvate kinase [Gammaproteobacteria bacterium]
MIDPNSVRRRTKIVATLGPATDEDSVLREVIRAGANVLRLNFSHGTDDQHVERIQAARRIAAELGRDVAVLGDLQGPKIRIQRFADGPVQLKEGATFSIDSALDADGGNEEVVGTTYERLAHDVGVGDTLMVNDGRIQLEVLSTEGTRVACRVIVGGEISNNKGINRQGGGLSAEALTAKDREDIKTAASLDVDYVAISFPRGAEDVQDARRLVRAAGGDGLIVAKIERAEAVQNIDSIIQVSDAVMVARGDLGVEIGDAELPGVQKDIIARARDANRVVITATQMMESMIESPIPTRAEVLDVANAVIDGTDAVMLSQETAAGKHPVKVVESVARVCLGAERQRETQISRHRIDAKFERIDEAIAMATMYSANHLDVRAIFALTESGSTALWMSRIRSGIPIFALTRHETTRRRAALYRGVYPLAFDVLQAQPGRVGEYVLSQMVKMGIVEKNDRVIFTRGDLSGISGGTNSMKIVVA